MLQEKKLRDRYVLIGAALGLVPLIAGFILGPHFMKSKYAEFYGALLGGGAGVLVSCGVSYLLTTMDRIKPESKREQ